MGREAIMIEIEDWLPLVKKIAGWRFARLGLMKFQLQIEYDDLYQVGALGLIKAAQTYNSDLAAPQTYFTQRINGDILDHLRTFPFFHDGLPVEFCGLDALFFLPSPLAETQRAEDRAEVEGLMRACSAQQRDVIESILSDTPQAEIAQRLHLTPGRVTQIRDAAIEAMRQMAA